MTEDMLGAETAMTTTKPSGDEGLEHLLRPSLASAPPLRALYSFEALFLTAFFGGPLAGAFFAGVNVGRAGRARQDLWLPVLAAVLWSGVLIYVGGSLAAGGFPTWLQGLGGRPQRNFRLLGQLAALTLVGLVYLRYRPVWTAQRLAGVEAPNPWWLGIGTIVGALLATRLIIGAGEVLAGA